MSENINGEANTRPLTEEKKPEKSYADAVSILVDYFVKTDPGVFGDPDAEAKEILRERLHTNILEKYGDGWVSLRINEINRDRRKARRSQRLKGA